MRTLSRRNRVTRALLRRQPPARLARLAMSDAAVGIADDAMAIATPYHGELQSDYVSVDDHLGPALRLHRATEQLLLRTVVYLLARGVGWEEISDFLGLDEQAAHERFDAGIAEWNELLMAPYSLDDIDDPPFGVLTNRFPVTDPDQTGARLDAAVRAWREQTGDVPADEEPAITANPVTASLPPEFPLEEMRRAVDSEEVWAWKHPEANSDPEYMAGLMDDKAEVLDGLAEEYRGQDKRKSYVRSLIDSFSSGAEQARTEAVRWRTEAETPGTDPA